MNGFYLPGRSVPVLLAAPLTAEVRTYRCVPTRITDGDTFTGDLQLGYGGLVATGRRMRFAGGNAWESRTEAGIAATANLKTRMPVGTALTVWLVSETADPHGRLLVTVRLDDGTDLIEQLIAQQWLARWNGRGTPPLPPWPREVAT